MRNLLSPIKLTPGTVGTYCEEQETNLPTELALLVDWIIIFFWFLLMRSNPSNTECQRNAFGSRTEVYVVVVTKWYP